jgi:hypothetical protein
LHVPFRRAIARCNGTIKEMLLHGVLALILYRPAQHVRGICRHLRHLFAY